MAELPQSTINYLAYIGATAERVGDDIWIIHDPAPGAGRPIFNSATIDSKTRFPIVVQTNH